MNFSKSFQNPEINLKNDFKELRKISEDFQILPKISKDF